MNLAKYFVIITFLAPCPVMRSAQFTLLHSFSSNTGIGSPQTTLVEISPGVFAGTYATGLFQITSSGTFTAGVDFAASFYALVGPGALAPASDGLFYGVRSYNLQLSEIFKTSNTQSSAVTVAGKLINAGPVTEGLDGNLWTTEGSPATGYHAIKVTLGGTVSVVGAAGNGQTYGPLLQASDGDFYGATFLPTATGAGQIYKITPQGGYQVLHTFPSGESSVGGLLQASNGLVYGTALYYNAVCPNRVGEIFSLTLDGQYTSLYTLKGCYPSGLPFGPYAGLVEASDGHLYTTTVLGGKASEGGVLRFSLDGSSISSVFSFTFDDGASPGTAGPALTQGSDGALYGTTSGGGSSELGVVYKLDLGLTPPLPSLRLYQPQSGAPGTTVRLKGDHLIGLSGVSFNGVPAQFRAVNVNYAYAVVPAGATTGPITVTTMNGSVMTSKDFVVP